jgi:Domain of unknown function (DUF4832)/Domain of unknown function (DUF4874)
MKIVNSLKFRCHKKLRASSRKCSERGRTTFKTQLLGLCLLSTFSGAASAQSWSNIASEGNSFNISGTKTVRYGIGTKWVYKSIYKKGWCTNDYFGNDPAWGISKVCQLYSDTAVVTPPVVNPPVVTAPPVATPTLNTTATMSSTTMEIANPERGFYGWGADYFQNITAANLVNLRDSQGLRLTLGLIDLSAYRTQNLPQSFLDTLNSKFTLLRSNGMKVIIRPVYNYNSSGSDANLAQVKNHIAQLAPLFANNADVISHIQAGFIGAWGEWHTSASGLTSDSNKASIRDALMANFPSQTPIEFRYPYDVIKWFPNALDANDAFNATIQSRVAIHNDCFMSSDNDVGTYQNNSLTNNPQREYTKKITEYVPFGGETCSGFQAPRKSCAAILSEGAQYHLNYLNINFDTSFINQWKNERCYSQVMKSIGYRFELEQITHPQSVNRNASLNVDVELKNVGWSRIFSARKLLVTLRNKNNGSVITALSSADMRSIASQGANTSKISINVPISSGASTGEYEVFLSLPDIYQTTSNNARFAVRFANSDNISKGQVWDATNARFNTGTVINIK